MVANTLKQLVQDEDAVSPVIGVILMVAVTVVLGAVIGAFVFGIGDQLGEPAPNAQIEWEYDSATANVTVDHAGGATINADNTGELVFTGDIGPSDNQAPVTVPVAAADLEFAAGDQIMGPPGSGGSTSSDFTDIESGDSVKLSWKATGGGSSSVLGEFTAP